MSIDMVTITLPVYAVRYLQEMCKRDREFLGCVVEQQGYGLALDASYDSLNAIECALPEKEP